MGKMRSSKELVTAAGTLALAAGIGFVMQSADVREDQEAKQPTPEIDVSQTKGASIIPRLESVQLTSARDDDDEVEQPKIAQFQRSCDVETSATVLPGAVVQIDVTAPCMANERLIVHHAGLMFTDVTDSDGHMQASVPAMSEDAVFVIAFDGGSGSVVQTKVEEINDFTRSALLWSGPVDFELHALEAGADYGTEGHVWSGASRTVEMALSDDRGFVITLGNSNVARPRMAEVYTYPIEDDSVDLRVETEINAHNCGMEVDLQSIEYRDGRLRSEEVVLTVPDCSVMGDLLILSNLIGTEVAAR